MQKIVKKLVVLGTGGTIAGTAASPQDHTAYTAAQIGVAQLLASIPGLPAALQGHALHCEQVAQIDSKDMDFATMARLAQRCAHHLAQPDVAAVVVTHGTDTLEETAYFLQAILAGRYGKPVVITCAMRPATSSESDGPRNLCDAFAVALDAQAAGRGVLCVCAGDVHRAVGVQKIHSSALNAFASGPAGPCAQVVAGQVVWAAATPLFYEENRPFAGVSIDNLAINTIADKLPLAWPQVELVFNYAGASGGMVRALVAAAGKPVGSAPLVSVSVASASVASPGVASPSVAAGSRLRGLVVAGTGNGTLSLGLQAALLDAQKQGIRVLRASRCAWGGVTDTPPHFQRNAQQNALQDGLQNSSQDLLPSAGRLSAVQARVRLVLELAAHDLGSGVNATVATADLEPL